MNDAWVDDYLRRIGYDGARVPSIEVLRALHERHLRSVPFENLDIHWKRPIVPDLERIVAKIVGERRGGFCYELNGAFGALLGALGFDVAMLSGRVVTPEGGFGPPFDHMALRVGFGDGTRWLADVGFGDSFLLPLDLDERAPQRDPAGLFRVEDGDEWQMLVQRGEAWFPEYRFTLAPQPLEAFAEMCAWQQTSPQSSFTKRRICTWPTEAGRLTITDGRVIATRDGMRNERAVAEEEWERELASLFGIRRGSDA